MVGKIFPHIVEEGYWGTRRFLKAQRGTSEQAGPPNNLIFFFYHMATYIILGIFVVIFVSLVYLARKATLDQLVFLPDEKTLFTEDHVRVESFFRGGEHIKAIYPHSHIVVTNKRIITSQPLLFRKNKFMIEHIIDYTDPKITLDAGDLLGGFMFKGAYITLPSRLEKIKLVTIKEKTAVEICVPFPNHGPLFRAEPKVIIFTNNPAEYQKHLNL